MSVLSVLLALLAALSNGAASVLQRRAVMEQQGQEGDVWPSPRRTSRAAGAVGRVREDARRAVDDVTRLGHLLRRPYWLAGAAALGLSAAFQAAALGLGRLSVVQPLLASELLFTLVVGSVVFHHRPDGRTWLSFLGLAVGLALFLGAASPSSGNERASGARWLPVGLCAVLLVAVLTLLARTLGGAGAATLLGAATAVSFSCTAALIKEVTGQVPQGLGQVFGTWHLYAACAAGLLSLLLLQAALAAGPLAASQPALTLVDAMVSVALGYALFGEHIRLGLRVLPQVVGLTLIALGVLGLSRSPAVAGGWEEAPEGGAPSGGPAEEAGGGVQAGDRRPDAESGRSPRGGGRG